ELFDLAPVAVHLPEHRLPGAAHRKIACHRCGQAVRDAREVWVAGRPLCRPCAGLAYFSPLPEKDERHAAV
ncbi:MAG: TraR/DksA C4-type zinc finger protein, partial [Thermaerobacter sp.]|nr:TraR/DksA C4-type zinc finger protein [Thermaerobacter sp.]